MTPEEAARLLAEELEAALGELSGPAARARINTVYAPPDFGPDRSFRIALLSSSGDTVELALPATLALAYLADEEAAVDEWRAWVREIWKRCCGSARPDPD